MPMNSFEDRFPRLWAVMERVGVLVTCGLLFWIFILPVVTFPAAVVGLLAAVGPLVSPATFDTTGRFWRGFRRSFGTALALGALDLVLGLILYVDIRYFWSLGSGLWQAAAYFLGSIAMVVAMVNVFAWPLLAWFPQPLGKLLKRSFFLTAAHPFLALTGLLGSLMVPALFILLPGALKGFVPLLGPGLMATAMGVAAWRAMKRYATSDDSFAA